MGSHRRGCNLCVAHDSQVAAWAMAVILPDSQSPALYQP